MEINELEHDKRILKILNKYILRQKERFKI